MLVQNLKYTSIKPKSCVPHIHLISMAGKPVEARGVLVQMRVDWAEFCERRVLASGSDMHPEIPAHLTKSTDHHVQVDVWSHAHYKRSLHF